MPRLRVVIIDDSLVFRTFLIQSLGRDRDIEIVGVYGDPVDALAHLGEVSPDVMTVDMEMPKMRGDDFLRTALPKHKKIRAVVISSLSANVFDAMHAGAIDFVAKPGAQPGYGNAQFVADILRKIKIAGGATAQVRPLAHPHTPLPYVPLSNIELSGITQRSIIAIGASTGGPEAIQDVVSRLPAAAPGVVIVQHMPPMFTKMYAERLDSICAMTVREAKNGDRVVRGTALVAPGGTHQMRVLSDSLGHYVRLYDEPKYGGHCPSVDVLFESVARAAGSAAVGILLTGMGADGAHGLLSMRRAGAFTIGQDEASCIVYGMPKVAFEIGGVSRQLPPAAIADAAMAQFAR